MDILLRTFFTCCSMLLSLSAVPAWANVDSLQLDELTSTEVRSKLTAGNTTILLPIGATEQSGPYLALGKHNVRVHLLAEQIAQKLGNTLVAPVLAYVPDGAVNPPTSHMRFAGTISIPDATFEAILEGAARSFKQHGFCHVVLLGDHGGYAKNLDKVAQKLNREWARESSCRVIALQEYYRLSSAGFAALLKKRGFSDAEIGIHAGLADTALSMALDKNLVRSDAMARQAKPGVADGVTGDPRRASAELGQLGVQLIVDGTVSAIRAEVRAAK
ncbi:MAG: creatininase family protein [Undibacterium sp.]|uniref:creatininase family protein n=1 Tax=Undibacterium sp. TaxID=1914977 RepID=UPI0027292B92|nr:creatininase family protein [Undibacterium sp.]MDO8651699.1 creatininase family protein [Undibacterium sp.]